MSLPPPKTQFAPIPVRAFSDDRLQPAHWRLLSAIAYHDRFGNNKRGCYAKHKTLATEIGVHEKTIAPTAADLIEWGYISAARNDFDRRLVVYSVLYEQPKSVMPEITDYDPVTGEIGNAKAAAPEKIGNVENRDIQQNQSSADSIIDTSEDVIDGVETL